MPSNLPKPTTAQLRLAAQQALTGQADIYGDTHDGSIYDNVFGPTAVLFAREADRDADLFSDCYFDNATGYALTKRGAQIYKVARILDSFGTGVLTVARPTASAGAGEFYQGTRVQVAGTPPMTY